MSSLQQYLYLLFLLPSLVLGECTCDADNEERNKHMALQYKLAAVASILVASAIEVCILILGKTVLALHLEKCIFFMIKAFTASMILSTGFIHVLPNAFESLTSSCLDENTRRRFSFAGLMVMTSAIGTLMVDAFATSYYNNDSCFNSAQRGIEGEEKVGEEKGHVHVHAHATHARCLASFVKNSASLDLVRHRVISQVLELGIVVHSVIIGMSLGASESPKTIRPLVVALTFQQFFEGIGLGGCNSQAKFMRRGTAINIVLFFSFTTPIGIAIRIGISNGYNENNPTTLIVEGILNATSVGILIYMALVDLLALIL